jgi:hypothetical protein
MYIIFSLRSPRFRWLGGYSTTSHESHNTPPRWLQPNFPFRVRLFSAALSLSVAITQDRVIRLSSWPGYSLSRQRQVDPGLVLTWHAMFLGWSWFSAATEGTHGKRANDLEGTPMSHQGEMGLASFKVIILVSFSFSFSKEEDKEEARKWAWKGFVLISVFWLRFWVGKSSFSLPARNFFSVNHSQFW